MNWLMWGKMFSYFYNKFRPVNHMHYIKCAVNSSLLTLLWLLQKVCGTLDSQRGWFTNLLWCDIPQNIAPQTGPHHVWCIYTLCRFCGCDKHTDSSAFGLMISLASVCYGDSWVAKHFLAHTWSYNQSGVGAILAPFSFLSLIPHQKKPEISVGIFSPTWR